MLFKNNKTSGLTAEIRVKRCYGCGAILQDQDPNEIGYVPTEKFQSEDETLCERCYKLRHYSSFKKTAGLNIDFVTILDHAKEENALAIYVVNAFSIQASVLKGIGKYLPKDVLVVINKRDLLPKSYNDDYLLLQTKKALEEENIHPISILVTAASATKNYHIEELMKAVEENRHGKSVYFVGCYQVGKSSLINALLMNYSNMTSRTITTSPYPGTTLDVISIPLDDQSNMYDTPGMYNAESMISFVEPEIIKYVLPRNEIRPEMYMAKEGQSFLLANLARLDFVKGDKVNFTFYKSNDLSIERHKLNKADQGFNDLCVNEGLDTRTKKVTSIQDLEVHHFTTLEGKTNRINVNGLMFVEYNGKNQEIDVYAPKGVIVTLEDASLKL